MESGELPLNERTVLVVDEAGMVGTRQMAALVKATEAAGAKLVLVGEATQLQPIEAGGAFAALGERLGQAELTEIRRQREPWAREAVRSVATGDARAGLRAYAERGLLTVADDREGARTALIADWKAGGLQQADENLILTSTNRDATLLNRQAQAARREAGCLGAGTVRVGSETVHEGDRVLFTRNSRVYGVKNGSLGTVLTADAFRETLTARLDGSGDEVTVPLSRYQAVKLGYAVTTHKAQGITVENAFVLAGGAMQDRELSYVQLSRTRGETRLYTDRAEAGEGLADLSRQMSNSRQKELALTYRSSPANEQRGKLARKIHL